MIRNKFRIVDKPFYGKRTLANRSPHCVRDDNLFLHLPATCHCYVTCPRILSLRWSETTEAISLQATFVFGLLRYARNDKSQDRRTAFAMTT
ncbi:MAG: hypothetical protein IIU83_09030, partial [Fibrobacteraceae bacterium]|nr:hypothetical protein [Fibrobacteraceae bacterium]